jgi:hypothetical protein
MQIFLVIIWWYEVEKRLGTPGLDLILRSRIFRFLWVLQLILYLYQEIMDFYKYLNRDFSSQYFLLTFYVSKNENASNFCFKNAKKVQKVLTKIRNLNSLENLN